MRDVGCLGYFVNMAVRLVICNACAVDLNCFVETVVCAVETAGADMTTDEDYRYKNSHDDGCADAYDPSNMGWFIGHL